MNNQSISSQKATVVWFRDDLRIADHPAFFHAAKSGEPIMALYILDEKSDGLRPLGSAQKWFLYHALKSLDESLGKIGGCLHLRSGKSREIIREIINNENIGAVHWNRRCGKAELEIDAGLKAELQSVGVVVNSFQGNLLHEPYTTKTGSGGPYRVYSPFWRSLIASGEPRAPFPAPEEIISYNPRNAALPLDALQLLPTSPDWAKGWSRIWNPSEKGAAERFDDFVANGIHGYKEGRDFPDRDNISRLSPFLRFGLISPYQVWHGIRHHEAADTVSNTDSEKFLKELAWREFSYHLLFHFPDIGWKNFQERFDEFPWRADGHEHLEAWQRGMTGYPIIDAGMRELWQTGYMHNRVRMVVGSFLVKHLLIDWRQGEKWFWDTLVDGDPANNPASWQWIAGCGADAAPYFRVFNPMLQGNKFDSDGEYVRKYVPELSKLPNQFIHAPFDVQPEILKQYGVTLGKTYPHPIVDHTRGRDRALEAFKELKKAD